MRNKNKNSSNLRNITTNLQCIKQVKMEILGTKNTIKHNKNVTESITNRMNEVHERKSELRNNLFENTPSDVLKRT